MLSSEEQNQLRETQVGDEVALLRMVYGKWRWTVATIGRLTPQHLGIDDELFSKISGGLRGYSRFYGRIAPLNAEYRQRIDTDTAKVKEEYIRQECITTLAEDILWTLPTRLLETLTQQVQHYLQGQGRGVPQTVDEWNALRAERL